MIPVSRHCLTHYGGRVAPQKYSLWHVALVAMPSPPPLCWCRPAGKDARGAHAQLGGCLLDDGRQEDETRVWQRGRRTQACAELLLGAQDLKRGRRNTRGRGEGGREWRHTSDITSDNGSAYCAVAMARAGSAACLHHCDCPCGVSRATSKRARVRRR